MALDGNKTHHNLGSGDSSYIADFLENPEEIYQNIVKEVTFLPRDLLTFQIFGKSMQLPRDKQFYGDLDKDGTVPWYRYGGNYVPTVHSWTATLEKLRDKVHQKTGQKCNHAVANRYCNGTDHIGYHHDKVRDFVDGSSVCTISLGTSRRFLLKNIKTDQIIEIVLKPGSLFILGPKTNAEWKHSIPKCMPVKDTRYTMRSCGIVSP